MKSLDPGGALLLIRYLDFVKALETADAASLEAFVRHVTVAEDGLAWTDPKEQEAWEGFKLANRRYADALRETATA